MTTYNWFIALAKKYHAVSLKWEHTWFTSEYIHYKVS